MFEEYHKAVKANDTPGRTFRLKVWLFEAKEEELTPEDISKAKRCVLWGVSSDSLRKYAETSCILLCTCGLPGE